MTSVLVVEKKQERERVNINHRFNEIFTSSLIKERGFFANL